MAKTNQQSRRSNVEIDRREMVWLAALRETGGAPISFLALLLELKLR